MADKPEQAEPANEETITLVTPLNKHKVVVRKNITGYDRRKIQAAYQGAVDLSKVDKDSTDNQLELKEDVYSLGKNKQIELMVVSVDGESGDVVNKILGMHAADNEFVENQLELISRGRYKEPEKKSSADSTETS